MKPAGIHHVAICVRDADEASTFYTEVLGLTRAGDRPDFGFGGYWLDAGGQQVHLMQSESSRSGGDHFAIRVDDLESAVADIRATGVTGSTRSTTWPAPATRRSCTTRAATSSS